MKEKGDFSRGGVNFKETEEGSAAKGTFPDNAGTVEAIDYSASKKGYYSQSLKKIICKNSQLISYLAHIVVIVCEKSQLIGYLAHIVIIVCEKSQLIGYLAYIVVIVCENSQLIV